MAARCGSSGVVRLALTDGDRGGPFSERAQRLFDRGGRLFETTERGEDHAAVFVGNRHVGTQRDCPLAARQSLAGPAEKQQRVRPDCSGASG